MIPYLRRSSSNSELSRLMDHITSSLGFRDAAAAFIRDDTFKLFRASDPGLAKRTSWRSMGALLTRARRAGVSPNLVVRRRSFETDRATKMEKTFFRRCLVSEIGQEQADGYIADEAILRTRYLKHLMFHGLSVKPSAFATALGAFVYGCGTESLMAVYDSVLHHVLNAWKIGDALDIFQAPEAPEAAVRQAKVNTGREIVERFRHLVRWQLQPDDFNDWPAFVERIKSGVEVTDRYIRGYVQRIDRTLLDQAHRGAGADNLCSALNQIMEDADFGEVEAFAQASGHRVSPLAIGHQGQETKNRRLLESAYRPFIKPSLEVLKPNTPAAQAKGNALQLQIIDDQALLDGFATFMEACGPWGIACKTAAAPAQAMHPANSNADEDGDAVDKAAADIKHVLTHQDCLRETSERARLECFKTWRPNMWLPSVIRSANGTSDPPARAQTRGAGEPDKAPQTQQNKSAPWRDNLRKWSRQRRKLRPEKLILMIDCVLRAELSVASLQHSLTTHLEAAGNANFVEVFGIDRDKNERVLLAACILEPQTEMKQTVSLGNQRFSFEVRYDGSYEIDFTYELIPEGALKTAGSRFNGYLLDGLDWFVGRRPVVRYTLVVLAVILLAFVIRPSIPRTLVARFIRREAQPQRPVQAPPSPESTRPNIVSSPTISPIPVPTGSQQREAPNQTKPRPTPTPFIPEPVAPDDAIVARLNLPGRSAGSPPMFVIPRETLVLSVEFEKAEQFDYEKYDATLFASKTGVVAKRWSGVVSRIEGSQRALSFAVPAAKLNAGNYTLAITGRRSNGAVGDKQIIYINLVRKPSEK